MAPQSLPNCPKTPSPTTATSSRAATPSPSHPTLKNLVLQKAQALSRAAKRASPPTFPTATAQTTPTAPTTANPPLAPETAGEKPNQQKKEHQPKHQETPETKQGHQEKKAPRNQPKRLHIREASHQRCRLHQLKVPAQVTRTSASGAAAATHRPLDPLHIGPHSPTRYPQNAPAWRLSTAQ